MILYALITRNCNLDCSFCDIKNNSPEEFNLTKFIYTINEFQGEIILFGGEPFFHIDRLMSIINSTDKELSITSNLVIPNFPEYIEKINQNKIHISTSWGLERFDLVQYNTWLDNLYLVKNPYVIITLTKRLLSSDPVDVIDLIKRWPQGTVVKFEPVIDPQLPKETYDYMSDWLIKLAIKWNLKNRFVENFSYPMEYHDCKDVYTLLPDGKLLNICPHQLTEKKSFCNDCLNCDYSDKCKPCTLQTYCYYKRFLAFMLNNPLKKQYNLNWK